LEFFIFILLSLNNVKKSRQNGHRAQKDFATGSGRVVSASEEGMKDHARETGIF
jgi:hypothetical protein